MIHTRLKLNYSGFALDVDLQLPGRGVTALYGHSGSGKNHLPALHRRPGAGRTEFLFR